MHCVVIGTGIVGAASGLALLRDGHSVTFIEPREPGGEQAASYGNGAWISPASVVPMSFPGLWKKVPGFLLDAQGPLTIRWASLPALLPWLVRFVRAGASIAKVERTARLLGGLLHDAPARHQALSSEIGASGMIRQDGLLYAYPDRKAFEAEALSWRLRRDNGIVWQELEGDALHRHEPALAARYRFAAFIPVGAHCLDPGRYVALLVEHAIQRGARLVRASATGFLIENDQLKAVETSNGPVPCDRAIISAGVHSVPLARAAGDAVSMASERGYHVVVDAGGMTLRSPVMPSDGKMANTQTTGGLRASGQVELASIDAAPDWNRAAILLKHLLNTYPALPRDLELSSLKRWMGHRPSTPDGLPVIGEASRCKGIIHAFGHGHVGLASAPVTADIVAALISGRTLPLSCEAFAATRFRQWL